MIQEIDNILKQVRDHKMRTFEARVRIMDLKDDGCYTRDEVEALIEDFAMSTYHIPLNDPRRAEACRRWAESKLMK